jgi:hypothetical protein
MRKMTYPLRRDIPENQINNGALILLLLKECKTWTELCRRYHDANPDDLVRSTPSIQLYEQLKRMKAQGLIEFEESVDGDKKPPGEIRISDHWTKIRMALGGIHSTDAALLSGYSNGMAVTVLRQTDGIRSTRRRVRLDAF